MKSFVVPLLLLCVLLPGLSLGNGWSYPDASLFVPGETDTNNPVDTGVDVPDGGILRILASGAVSWGPGPSPFCVTGPSGSAGDISGSVPGAPFICLVAKIGDGPWFAAGEMYERSYRPPGRLYLAINDSYYHDNLGSYFVNVWTNLDPGVSIPPLELQTSPGVGLKSAPNPFRRTTGILYTVPAGGEVTLRIFDVGGALVRTLVNGSMAPGEHEVSWDGRDDRGGAVSSGTYIYQIACGGQVTSEKTLLLR